MQPFRREPRAFFLAAIGLSTTTWNVAFNLGAYHTIFFRHLFSAWVVVTVILLATLVLPDQDAPITWPRRLLLFVPSLAVMVEVLYIYSPGVIDIDPIVVTLRAAVLLICLPFSIYVALTIVNPDLLRVRRPRYRLALLLLVGIIFVSGYSVGARNDLFLTCGDFAIAGEHMPDNCRPGDARQF